MQKILIYLFAIIVFVTIDLYIKDEQSVYIPPEADRYFVIYNRNEVEEVNKTIKNIFESSKKLIIHNEGMKHKIEKTNLNIINNGSMIAYTRAVKDNYYVNISYGVYRRALSLSLLYNSRTDVNDADTSSCVHGYFDYINRFEKNPGTESRLPPRIDKHIKSKCPHLSQKMRTFAESGNIFVDDAIIFVNFIILHEMAHVGLGHFDSAFSKEKEYEADSFALKYLMFSHKMEYKEAFERMMIYINFTSSSNLHNLSLASAHPQAAERFGRIIASIVEYYDWIQAPEQRNQAEQYIKITITDMLKAFGMPVPSP